VIRTANGSRAAFRRAQQQIFFPKILIAAQQFAQGFQRGLPKEKGIFGDFKLPPCRDIPALSMGDKSRTDFFVRAIFTNEETTLTVPPKPSS
jgi:hypothetical protein